LAMFQSTNEHGPKDFRWCSFSLPNEADFRGCFASCRVSIGDTPKLQCQCWAIPTSMYIYICINRHDLSIHTVIIYTYIQHICLDFTYMCVPAHIYSQRDS
jgi:hypothetical protein